MPVEQEPDSDLTNEEREILHRLYSYILSWDAPETEEESDESRDDRCMP